MTEQDYDYIIVGAGLAGASAIEGIRAKDEGGSILLVGSEDYLPYNRPPLSKRLWFGEKKVEDIFVQSRNFYTDNFVDVLLSTEVIDLDARRKTITDNKRNSWKYGKLLLATGGIPRSLDIPGGDLDGVCYYRYLKDYLALENRVGENTVTLIIGGGFIGSELAAAVTHKGSQAIMVFPGRYICSRVLPEGLSRTIEDNYKTKGIVLYKEDVPVSIEKSGKDKYLTKTQKGKQIESDIIIVGVGIIPATMLAEQAEIRVENGIAVNEKLQTSNQFIYAAGDNASFPYITLGSRMRIEHWDNAYNQGKQAGLNMASRGFAYDYMPFFWSSFFDFEYEAVGDIDSRLDIYTDWLIENETGVIYYLQNNKVRGVMTCNIYGKIDDARQLIKSGKEILPDDLRGAIR